MEMTEELKDLQDKLAFVDLMAKSRKEGITEILLKKKLPLEFRMEPDHHGAPHIHINYGKGKHVASYRVNDGVKLNGQPEKYDKSVKEWILLNRILLQEIWTAMKAGDQKTYEVKIGQLL